MTLSVAAACAPAPSGPPSQGVNDWGCRPAAGREPVVLLHGLGATGGLNWFTKAPLIAGAGYCVFTPTYGVGAFGIGGLQSMRSSAAEIATYIDSVRTSTGSAKVDIVGHSEGTAVATYYMKFLGGNTKVRHFVGFGSIYKGTTLYGLSVLAHAVSPILDPVLDVVCASCTEFLPPSQFIDDLNAGGVTRPGPTYTNLVTTLDEVVVPYTSGILDEPGVTNIVLQQHCIADLSGHVALAVDPNVTGLVIWALGGEIGPRPPCIPFVAPL